MDLLHRTTIHFVHCILPQHNAGLCDLKTSMMSAGDGKPNSRDDVMLNVPLVRAQVRGAQLVDAVRLHRQGMYHFLYVFADWSVAGGMMFFSCSTVHGCVHGGLTMTASNNDHGGHKT